MNNEVHNAASTTPQPLAPAVISAPCRLDALAFALSLSWKDPMRLLTMLRKRRSASLPGKPSAFTSRGIGVLVHPLGIPRFRHHLEIPQAHIYISDCVCPKSGLNTYVELKSELLGDFGTCLSAVEKFLAALGAKKVGEALQKPKAAYAGGHVLRKAVMAAEFIIPGGFSEGQLREEKCSHAGVYDLRTEKSILTEFTVGKYEVILRIYKKARPTETADGTEDSRAPGDTWRIELSLTGKMVRDLLITLPDVPEWPRAWCIMMAYWFSLRAPSMTRRRHLTSLWRIVVSSSNPSGSSGPQREV